MITFNVTNTRVEGNEIIVFFIFSNGEESNQRFPITSSFVDIMAWGAERAEWFYQREMRTIELEAELRNLHNSEVV